MRVRRAALLLCLLSGSIARGNGRPPAPLSVALETGGARRILVSTTFGLLISQDRGETWRWVCERSAYAGTNLGVYDPRFVFTASGAIVGALSSGLVVSRDGGCSFAMATGALAGMWVSDVAASPADPKVVYAVTSSSAKKNGLFISRNDGVTFEPAAPLDPVSFYRRVVAVGQVAYVSGYDALQGGHNHLWKYESGTLTAIAPGGELATTMPIVDLVSASAATEGRLYAVGSRQGQGAVFRSDDAGKTWRTVYTASLVRAALADRMDRLFVAPLSGLDLSLTGEAPFGREAMGYAFSCLSVGGDQMWGCTPSPGPGELGVRAEDGSWTDKLDFQRNVVGVISCPGGTPTEACQAEWPLLAAQLGLGAHTPDGGTGSPPIERIDGSAAPARSGDGCHMGGTMAAGCAALVGLALVGLLLGRRGS